MFFIISKKNQKKNKKNFVLKNLKETRKNLEKTSKQLYLKNKKEIKI